MNPTRTANVGASFYDAELSLDFDCVGVEVCKFALCSEMPPDGSEECFFRRYGSCTSAPAQYAAIERLRDRLTKELKERREEEAI